MSNLDQYQTLDTRLCGRRKNDQFFMNLVDIMNVGVVVTDCERKIIYLNNNFKTMTGLSDHNMIGCDLADSFDFSNSELLKNTYQDCHKNIKSTVELSWRLPSGKHIDARISLTSFETASPVNRLYYAVLTDITKLKHAHKAIIHSESKYKAVIENSPTGLFIEQDNKIMFANQRLAEMLGFEMNLLIGMETRHFFQSAYHDSTDEFQTHDKDGKVIWVKLNSHRIAFRGKPAILFNVIEISREKILEHRLLDLERKLGTITDKMRVDQENQRKRIAMELHNGIGKSLTETQSIIEKSIKKHPSNSNLINELRTVAILLQNATEEAKRIAITLHPAFLDDLGLKATMIWHCQQYQSIHPSIKISLIVNIDENQMTESLKTAIYMIMHEALNNIVEHIGTTHVKIHLFASTGMLNLVIKDNGQCPSLNTDESDRPYRFGFGRSSLKERIRQTGGRLAIGMNHENQGKYLCFSWPMDSSKSLEGH